MDILVREWAGKERAFRLPLGGVMDLEEAVGDKINPIYVRVVSGSFGVKDLYYTLRLALVGGGMDVLDAKRLVDTQFDAKPYMEHATTAGEVLSALITGVEEMGNPSGDAPDEPIKFSEVSQICTVFNVSPLELREMRYSDYVNMVRGYNAGADTKAPHLTEDEFADILNRYEGEVE